MSHVIGTRNAEQAAGALAAASIGAAGVLALTIGDVASAALTYTGLPFGIRVVDFHIVTTGDPGANANTEQLRTNAGAPVSSVLSTNGVGDAAVVRTTTISDATHEFAAGATIQINHVKVGGVASSIAYVKYLRI